MPMTPTVDLKVIGSRSVVPLTAIIDTGFNGDLCLPTAVAVRLGLELVSEVEVELADGTRQAQLVFAGSVRFLGRKRPVYVHLTNSEDALIGTGLLAECRLYVDFATGQVRVTRKSTRAGKRKRGH
jgi:clan AA aspartic protease